MSTPDGGVNIFNSGVHTLMQAIKDWGETVTGQDTNNEFSTHLTQNLSGGAIPMDSTNNFGILAPTGQPQASTPDPFAGLAAPAPAAATPPTTPNFSGLVQTIANNRAAAAPTPKQQDANEQSYTGNTNTNTPQVF